MLGLLGVSALISGTMMPGWFRGGHSITPVHPARVSFPRAYFGLPINFRFKDEDCGEPPELQLLPDGKDSDRMASPLILTPYKLANGNYAAAALKLPADEADTMSLRLKRGNNNQAPVPQNRQNWDAAWDNWTNNWWQASKAIVVRPIRDNQASNPLDAFMNYFGGE